MSVVANSALPICSALHLWRRLAFVAVACLGMTACGDDGSLFGSSNKAPRADAGEDQQITVGETVVLEASASDDPDGDPVQYAWTLVTGPVWVGIDSASSPRAHVRFPVEGTFEFRLTVVDDSGASDQADIRVTVAAVPTADGNRRPEANAGTDGAAVVGQVVVLDGSASADIDGDSLAFLWVQVEGSGVILRDGDQARAQVQFVEPGNYVFRLVAVDPQGSSNSDMVALSVTGVPAPPPNQLPVADAGPATHVFAGDTVTLDGRASMDPDGDALAWFWTQVSGPTNAVITNSAASTATVTPQVAGTYVFRLTVTDGRDQATADVRVVAAERVGSIQVEGFFDTGAP